jgi:hypothetical protein
VQTATGTVDFTSGELEMSWCCSWSTGKREITMDVREVGAVEYTFVPVPPLNSSGWTAQRVPRKLNELQFPLYAISKNEKVSAQGLERGPGWTGTSYLVHVPGGNIDGARVVPYVIDLALDNRGRIRSAGELVPEVAAKGHQGKGTLSTTIDFSDFGLPVHVQAPRNFTWSQGNASTTIGVVEKS